MYVSWLGHSSYYGWGGTILALVPLSPIMFTWKFVRKLHGEALCGADQTKKQAPHLKTGTPVIRQCQCILSTYTEGTLSVQPSDPYV